MTAKLVVKLLEKKAGPSRLCNAPLFPRQNKCVRYWPDLNATKEFGKVSVKNVEECPAQDYILRELEVTRLDRVRQPLVVTT